MYKSVRPSSILKKRFGHLSSLSKSDLTRICRELTERFAMNWMQGMQKREETKRSLDEVGNKYAWDKCKSTEKNTRELHLEMVGDKVTYVRVYWLRSQVRSLDHRSYSSFKLKMGLPFFCLSILMYSHLVELLWLMTWSKASLRWNNIPWVVELIMIM